MSREPNIKIPVDLTNPGQFFACCGLLELADRLWPGAEGWIGGREFCIQFDGTLRTLLACLILDRPEPQSFIECWACRHSSRTQAEAGNEGKTLAESLVLSYNGYRDCR